jgi:hypothetical protein
MSQRLINSIDDLDSEEILSTEQVLAMVKQLFAENQTDLKEALSQAVTEKMKEDMEQAVNESLDDSDCWEEAVTIVSEEALTTIRTQIADPESELRKLLEEYLVDKLRSDLGIED